MSATTKTPADEVRRIAALCCATGTIVATGIRREFLGTFNTHPLDARDQIAAGSLFNLAEFGLIGVMTTKRGAA